MTDVIVYSVLHDGQLISAVLTDLSLVDDYESYLNDIWCEWSSSYIIGENLKCLDDNDYIKECIEDWKESKK